MQFLYSSVVCFLGEMNPTTAIYGQIANHI